MENDYQPNHRVGFHVIEMLLKLKPDNIKQIFVPANRNDNRIQKLEADLKGFYILVLIRNKN